MRKTTKKKIAPIVITTAVVLYMVPLVLMVLAAAFGLGRETSAMTPFLLAYFLLGGAVVMDLVGDLIPQKNTEMTERNEII